MSLQPGQTFAGYTILRLLGAGGMGTVYLAQHPRLPRQYAIKVLPAELTSDPQYAARFLREAELAASLSHPHIVGVHDRGEYEGQFWISMDYVDGTDASRLLTERYPNGMPVTEVVPIITAVASALDFAHDRGLLHRDVKPANILLDFQAHRILLADFGIARRVDDSARLTATDMAVGTAAYAAPEQLRGEAVDGRADQYALACTAFHLLTGAPPYGGTNPAVVITQHVMAPVPSLGRLRSELGSLDPLFVKAMAKHPAERFSTCREFAHELQAHAAAPSALDPTQPTLVRRPAPRPVPPPAHPSPPVAPPTRRKLRPRVVIPVLAAVVLLIAAGVFASVTFFRNRHAATNAAATAGPFTGTYRADYGPGTTLDGEPVGAPPITGTWAVRSVCRSSGCVATASYIGTGGTVLVSNLVFDQVGGSWVAVGLSSLPCNDVQSEAWVTFTLQPRPDGTFTGVTTRATTDGCSNARRTVTFTRTADVDNAAAPDPATLPPRQVSLAAALYGRYHQTITYANGGVAPEVTDLNAQTFCLRTGDRCISLLHAPGGVVTLVFADGKWTQDMQGTTQCRLGNTAEVKVTGEYPLPQPLEDPIPLLTGRGHVASKESTCQGGDFDAKFERIGD